MYLRLFRKLRGSSRSSQYLSKLKLCDRVNFYSILDAGAYVYWYKLQEANQILKQVFFEVIAIGSSRQIQEGRMHTSSETLLNEIIKGQLYFVCKK